MQLDRRETLTATFLYLLMLLGNSILFAIVSYISAPAHGGYSAFQIVLCYSAMAFVMLIPWAIRQGIRGLKSAAPKLQLLRAVIEYTAFCLTFTALHYIGDDFTLPMHTSLNFLSPLLATPFTLLVLKEKSHLHTWLALIAGFVGVLIITRPGVIPLSPGAFYVMAAATCFSTTGAIIKLITRVDSPMHIAFYMLGLTSLLALPAGILHWKTPDGQGWLLLLAVGLIALLQQVCVAKAIAKVPFTVLIPLNFSQLLFATILSYFLYHKLITGPTILGALVILLATLYNGWKNTQQAATIRHESA